MAREVEIYDTTLRDGIQGHKVNVSFQDKLAIARRLDKFGVHYIELGWPGANPKDSEAFARFRNEKLEFSKIAAFGMTRKKGVPAEKDANLISLVESGAHVVTIFGKTWKLHVSKVLETTPEDNLEMIKDSVRFLLKQSHIEEVIFDAEHFFDGYEDDSSYALQCLEAASSAGASRVVLCDTRGGTLTSRLRDITEKVMNQIHIPVGIHAHNDSGLAVANSLAAVEVGASQVQGTINGIGERTGNADLIQVIANLEFKMGIKTVKSGDLKQLTDISRYIYDATHVEPSERQPFVGRASFTHGGGVHTHAMRKTPTSYEHISPESVGNFRNILGSEVAGRSSFISIGKKFGIKLNPDEAAEIAKEVKQKANLGYQFEIAHANLYLLLLKSKGLHKDAFKIKSWEIVSGGKSEEKLKSVGKVEIEIGNETRTEEEEGIGPFDALDRAIRKGLKKAYPQIENVKLVDYRVVPVDISLGTESAVRVNTTFSSNGDTWSSQGVSADSLEAGKESLETGYKYFLSSFRSS